MKTLKTKCSLLIIILNVLPLKSIQAQTDYNTVSVCKWEGITKDNQRIFGVAPTIDNAIAIKERYNKEHLKTNSAIIHYAYTTASIKHQGKTSFFKNFQKLHPKQYVTFSLEDQQAISIYMSESLSRAISYYSTAKNISYSAAQKHLDTLILRDCSYKLNFKLNLKNILF